MAAKAELEGRKSKLAKLLPHLHGWKFYKWAREFFESTNPMTILCAANQISKSSTAIRKTIEWSTNKSLWPKLWPTTPKQFWYLYPSSDVATVEFHNKWVPEFMPKMGQFIGERKKEQCIHPVYGWKAIYQRGQIHAIEWTSGVTVYFKTYAQNVHTLQSGSCYFIVADEELPSELYDELAFRTEGVGGYFNMVFTATRNQLMWYLAIEAIGTSMEKFKSAKKLQVTMYDCMEYEDGTPGHFNEAKIERAKSKCKNKQEELRRVYGRFVQEQGRKYPTFDPSIHMVKPFSIPQGWSYYGGVDPGSGGVSNHPSGMGIIAVNPDRTLGYIVDGWRGDGIETSAGDTLDYFLKLKAKWPKLTTQVYDQADKDFDILSTRMGEPFQKADKSHELGESIVNTLFKNNMLKVFDTPELNKLARELMMLMSSTNKRVAEDDLIDGALRYPAMAIPWDFTNIKSTKITRKERVWTELDYKKQEIDERRGVHQRSASQADDYGQDYTQDIADWNEMYGN